MATATSTSVTVMPNTSLLKRHRTRRIT
jgi:hypothetical protein